MDFSDDGHNSSLVFLLILLLRIFSYASLTRNFKARILDAYQWLAENYVDGDRIFLFGNIFTYVPPNYLINRTGFSRGAYQVRVIAGMLHRV